VTEIPPSVRTGLTLGVLVLIVVIGFRWGLDRVTEPLPGSDDDTAAGCVPFDVNEGEQVTPEMVEVSVLNASNREGLANAVLADFVEAGFLEGTVGNAPSGSEVGRSQVWAPARQSPDVRLVRSWMKKPVPVVDRDVTASGVVVVVGTDFDDLKQGRNRLTAKVAATVCEP